MSEGKKSFCVFCQDTVPLSMQRRILPTKTVPQ